MGQKPFPHIALSCVLPVYNEEEIIDRTIRSVHAYLSGLVGDFEIVAVDDGSRDRTPEILKSLQRIYPQLRVVAHPENRGYGEALKTGYANAGKPYVFIMDSDGQMEMRDLEAFLPLVPEFDLVIGERVRRADAPLRTMQARLYRFAARVLLGVPYKDLDCAFKLFKREVWEAISPLRCRGLVVSAEFIWRSMRAGFRIRQLAVRHYPRRVGSAKAVKPSSALRAIWELCMLWRERIGGGGRRLEDSP